MEQGYDALLELAADVGYRLLVSGAEIYRVEESVRRILDAYGAPGTEVFAIPNCIIVNLAAPDGHTLTRMRRVPAHGTDIYLLEAYNDLCRVLCEARPTVEEARRLISRIENERSTFSYPAVLAGYFVGTGAFTMLYGGVTLGDGLCGGLCGVAIGLCSTLMDRMEANAFFRTMAGGTVSAMLALLLVHLGLGQTVDSITIGALMALVPGVVFTNAMRDIMAGDLVAGLSKAAEALLIGTAIALGTGLALAAAGALFGG